MFKPLDAPENVWAMKISGDVSVEDVHAMYAELDAMLKANKTIGVVMDIGDFSDASPEAISADVKHELSLLGNITQFKRMALLTDKKWISYLVERLDPVIPTMKMKIFSLGESEAAINWAASE